MLFNINESVRVKLTSRGVAILKRQHDNLALSFPTLGEFELKLDSEGYYKTQLWCLIQKFGTEISLGFEPPFETTIDLVLPRGVNLNVDSD